MRCEKFTREYYAKVAENISNESEKSLNVV